MHIVASRAGLTGQLGRLATDAERREYASAIALIEAVQRSRGPVQVSHDGMLPHPVVEESTERAPFPLLSRSKVKP